VSARSLENRRTPSASLAIDNLRAIVILLVLAFHSVLAYLNFLPTTPYPFDLPPYLWRAVPIIDSKRWFGFDLFCAWQDIFLISLFFFLSGLFVWPSLRRKGVLRFLHDRFVRIGLPCVLVVAFLMPLASYATYLQTGGDPGLADFWRHWRALPFWPCGPMWFLWLLLAADGALAGLRLFAPHSADAVVRLSSWAGDNPIRLFASLSIASALAYVPMALAFTPSAWASYGPFSFQLSRPLHYAVYFVAGIGVGAHGIERGMFAPSGRLARSWALWLTAALTLFSVWIGLSALVMAASGAPSLELQILDDLSFVVACLSSCICVLAVVLRFAGKASAALDSIRTNAYGMYLVHYLFVVWLQYVLLGAELPALIKGALVFCGTLALSWGAVATARHLRWAAGPMIAVDRVRDSRAA